MDQAIVYPLNFCFYKGKTEERVAGEFIIAPCWKDHVIMLVEYLILMRCGDC